MIFIVHASRWLALFLSYTFLRTLWLNIDNISEHRPLNFYRRFYVPSSAEILWELSAKLGHIARSFIGFS